MSQDIYSHQFESAAEITDSIEALKAGDEFRTNMTGYFEKLIWMLRMRAAEHARLRDFEKAVEDYNKIINFDSTDKAALMNKARTLYNLRRLEEASSAFAVALKYDPENAQAWKINAMILDMLGRKEEAEECLKKYNKLTGD